MQGFELSGLWSLEIIMPHKIMNPSCKMELNINARKKAVCSVDGQTVLLNAALGIREGEERRGRSLGVGRT